MCVYMCSCGGVVGHVLLSANTHSCAVLHMQKLKHFIDHRLKLNLHCATMYYIIVQGGVRVARVGGLQAGTYDPPKHLPDTLRGYAGI